MDEKAQKMTEKILQEAAQQNRLIKFKDLAGDIKTKIDQNSQLVKLLGKENIYIMLSDSDVRNNSPPAIWHTSPRRFLTAVTTNAKLPGITEEYYTVLPLSLITYLNDKNPALLKRIIRHENSHRINKKENIKEAEKLAREAAEEVLVKEAMLKEDWKYLLGALKKSLKEPNSGPLMDLLQQCDQAVRDGISIDSDSEEIKAEIIERARKMWLIDGGYQNESKETQDRRYADAAADIIAQYSAKARIAPIESRYPLLKVVTLLTKKEEGVLFKYLKAVVDEQPHLRQIPLIDFMLLMLGDIPKDWAEKLVPHLKGAIIFIYSPEGRLAWKGGLGPVITFHGDAMERLLAGFARLIHIENDYGYIRDKSGALRALDYNENASTKINNVERWAEADFEMSFNGRTEGEKAKVEVRKGFSPTGAEVVLLRHIPEEKGPNYTKVVYDYNAPDNDISWEEFSSFYCLAALRFSAWFVKGEQERQGEDCKIRLAFFTNDAQSALINVFIRISDDEKNNGLLKSAMSDLLPVIAGFKKNALRAMVTHTYFNRRDYNNDEANRKTIKWMTGISDDQLLNEIFLRVDARSKKELLDITTGGLRTANWRGAVSAKHARDVKRLYDPEIDIVGVTNGTDLKWLNELMEKYFKELIEEGVFKAGDVDFLRPTAMQVLKLGEKAKKGFLNALIEEETRVRAYLRWEKEGGKSESPDVERARYLEEVNKIRHEYREIFALDPNKLAVGYVGRLVPEKFWWEEIIPMLVQAGIDVVIGGFIQTTYSLSTDMADRLEKLKKRLLDEKKNGDGNFIFIGSFNSKVKQAMLEALDKIVLLSEEDSEGSGFSEVPATHALVEAPPYRNGEGTILSQGIPLDYRTPGWGNTVIPKNRSLEACLGVLLKANDQWKYERRNFGAHQATSARLKRVINALFTGATYLKEFDAFFSEQESPSEAKAASPIYSAGDIARELIQNGNFIMTLSDDEQFEFKLLSKTYGKLEKFTIYVSPREGVHSTFRLLEGKSICYIHFYTMSRGVAGSNAGVHSGPAHLAIQLIPGAAYRKRGIADAVISIALAVSLAKGARIYVAQKIDHDFQVDCGAQLKSSREVGPYEKLLRRIGFKLTKEDFVDGYTEYSNIFKYRNIEMAFDLEKQRIPDIDIKIATVSSPVEDITSPRKVFKGVMISLLCAALIAIKPFFAKELINIDKFEPLVIQANYYLQAFVILFIYKAVQLARNGRRLAGMSADLKISNSFKAKQWLTLASQVLFSQILASPLYYFSLKHNSIFLSEVIIKSAPIFIALLSPFLSTEKMTAKKIIGIASAVVGVSIIIFAPQSSLLVGTVTLLGLIFAFLSSVSYAFSEITKKKTRDLISASSLLFWGYLIALPVMVSLSYSFGGGFTLIFNFPIIMISAISLATLLMSYFALDYLSPSVNKSITNTSPVFTLVALSIVTLTFPDIFSVIGVLLTISGIVFATINHSAQTKSNTYSPGSRDAFDMQSRGSSPLRVTLGADITTRLTVKQIRSTPVFANPQNKQVTDIVKNALGIRAGPDIISSSPLGINAENYFLEQKGPFSPDDPLIQGIKSIESIDVPGLTTPAKDNQPLAIKIKELMHIHAIVACHVYKWLNNIGNKFTKNQADGEAAYWYGIYYDLLKWLRAKVVIGEGERDEAPMLYIGQHVGGGYSLILKQRGKPDIAIGIDVVELTNGVIKEKIQATCSPGMYSEIGGLLSAPDLAYLATWVVGQAKKGREGYRVDIRKTAEDNIKSIAMRLDKAINELRGGILLRPRHSRRIVRMVEAGISIDDKDAELMQLIQEYKRIEEICKDHVPNTEDIERLKKSYKALDKKVKAAGIYKSGNLYLLADGTVMPTLAIKTDMMDFFTGGVGPTEGVMAAALCLAIGGESSSRLVAYGALKEENPLADLEADADKFNEEEIARLAEFGIVNPNTPDEEMLPGQIKWDHVFDTRALAPGKEVVFIASAIKDMPWVKGMHGVRLNEETGEMAACVIATTAAGQISVYRITYETAISIINKQIQHPDNNNHHKQASLYYQLGKAYGMVRLFNKAEEAFMRSQELRRDHSGRCQAAIKHSQGMQVLLTGHINNQKVEDPNVAAIAYFEKALELSKFSRDPSLRTREILLDLYEYLGDEAAKIKDYKSAEHYYTLRIKRDPTNPNILKKLKKVESQEGVGQGSSPVQLQGDTAENAAVPEHRIISIETTNGAAQVKIRHFTDKEIYIRCLNSEVLKDARVK
ncbi:MAG: fructose-bisphosphatase class II, partial [Candidatus Omnitrophica bacterium]|nr:fructose-bisphosphatase class II [Candidatus Omnitrophota bacterium]